MCFANKNNHKKPSITEKYFVYHGTNVILRGFDVKQNNYNLGYFYTQI